MKRIITLVLALIMVSALFVGCNNNANNPSDSTTPDAGTTTPKSGDTTPSGTTSDKTSDKTPETTPAQPDDTTTDKPKETTTDAPKVELPAIPEGTMVYFENFDSYADANDSEAVAKLLGWTILNKADGALTDNSASYALEGGALKITNWDNDAVAKPVDCYVLMTTSEYMAAACQGDYTVQFDIKYTAVKSNDRYITIIENFDGCNSYNTFHLRAYGTAHLQCRLFGEWKGTYDLRGSEFDACADDTKGDSCTSIAKKLLGKTYNKDEAVLLNIPITVRIQCSYNDGPIIWLRDNSKADAQFVCVAKYDLGSNGAIFWNAIEEYALCLKVGGGIDGYVDNIAVWTGLGEVPTDTSTTAYTTAIADYLAKVSK